MKFTRNSIVSHRKLSTLRPVWSQFCGYSLIFEDLPLVQNSSRTVFIGSEEGLDFVAAVTQAVSVVGRDRLMNDLLLCLLPPYSYHVTAADLLNEGNVKNVVGFPKEILSDVLTEIQETPFVIPHLLSDMGFRSGENEKFGVRFRFEGLESRNGRALMVLLKPDGPKAEESYSRMLAWHNGVSRKMRAKFGFSLSEFKPHLTLGYFANRKLARKPHSILSELGEVLRNRLDGLYLPAPSVGLYSFTSMETFNRLKTDSIR